MEWPIKPRNVFKQQTQKNMKILEVKQLKAIQVESGGFIFPISSQTSLILDKKSPANRKEHQLIYQQGSQYGEVGDRCTYLNNKQLLELEEKGMIKIKKASSKSKLTPVYFQRHPYQSKIINIQVDINRAVWAVNEGCAGTGFESQDLRDKYIAECLKSASDTISTLTKNN